MNLVGILLILGLTMLSGSFAHADDGAAGFEWASAREVYEKSECYTESGGYLRNSQAFTDGCLSFLGEAPSGTESTNSNTEVIEEEPASSVKEETPSRYNEEPAESEEEKVSNKDFIPDNWGK